MSKKIIKLTESDLERIVKRVINETYGGVGFGAEPNGLKIQKMETKEQSGSDLKPGQNRVCVGNNSTPIKFSQCKAGITGTFRFDIKKQQQPWFSELYKVASGDTISGILRKLNSLGTTVDSVVKLNGLRGEKDIRPNDILLLPINMGD
jgi:hypothetical protein